jgi:hypothetical protein
LLSKSHPRAFSFDFCESPQIWHRKLILYGFVFLILNRSRRFDSIVAYFNSTKSTIHPKAWPHVDISRFTANVYFDGPNLPPNLDWVTIPFAADYYIFLQLITQGLPNRLSTKFVTSPSAMGTPGGVASQRTLELHNAAAVALRRKYPKYVTLSWKRTNGHPFPGQERLAMRIDGKKAFADAQRQ